MRKERKKYEPKKKRKKLTVKKNVAIIKKENYIKSEKRTCEKDKNTLEGVKGEED